MCENVRVVVPLIGNVTASLKSAFVASCSSYAASRCWLPFHVIGYVVAEGATGGAEIVGTRGPHCVVTVTVLLFVLPQELVTRTQNCVGPMLLMLLVSTGPVPPLTGFDGSPDCARNH